MSQKYTNKLQNRRVLVIGGTSGIGFAVAEASIELGAIVVIASSSQEKIAKASDALKKSYPTASDRIRGHTLNLMAEDVETQFKALLDFATSNATQKLDHIVETAGDTLNPLPFRDLTVDSLHNLGKVRVVSALLAAKYSKQYMHDNPGSSITLTSGISGSKPADGRGLLSAVATVKEGITRGMAKDLRPIRVNLIAPGMVHTELLEGAAERMGIPLEQFLESRRKLSLTGTIGTPEGISESYLALMKNGFSTGSVVNVDGGYLLA